MLKRASSDVWAAVAGFTQHGAALAAVAVMCVGYPAVAVAATQAPPVNWQTFVSPGPGPNPITLDAFSAESSLSTCILDGKYGKSSRFVGFDDNADLTTITMADKDNQPHSVTVLVVESASLPKFTVALNAERARQRQSRGSASGVAVTLLVPAAGGCAPFYLNCVRMEMPVKCSGGTDSSVRSLCMGVAFTATESATQAHSDLAQLKAIMEADADDDAIDYYLNPNGDVLLPSGIVMPKSTSPYQTCRDKMGGRPDPTGLTDPCDKAITEFARCAYDAKCDAMRALEKARRSTIMAGCGGAAAIGGAALLVCSGPPGWAVGLVTAVVIVAGGYTVGDSSLCAVESCEDAKAALARIKDCWKTLLAASADCQ